MGATTFTTKARGASAKEAFNKAVESALYENGHGGYTGTIAEKRNFVMIKPSPNESPRACAERLLDSEDGPVSDKYGPAGCVDLGDGEWLFFGWAST